MHEAARHGHTVTAVVRSLASSPEFGPNVATLVGDVLDPVSVAAAAKDADAVVLAIGGPAEGFWANAAKTVVSTIAGLKEPKARVIHMGGGASLLAADGTRFLDSPHFPKEFFAPAKGQADALDWYRDHAAASGVTWTYVSPPPVDFAPGERRGAYRTSLDTPVVDAEGKSVVSYEDFAVAIIDEIEEPAFLNMRFTVGY